MEGILRKNLEEKKVKVEMDEALGISDFCGLIVTCSFPIPNKSCILKT